jgi:amino acid adenylation domain-containing protein
VARILIDADAADWAGEPETDPARGALTPDHLAYVIYTSGSTGRPKGVMNQHRTLVNRLAWGREAWGIDADEAVLCKTSLNFDGSVREIFLPLMAGGRVVLARPGGHRDPSYLLGAIGREGITTLNLVPSLLQVLLDAPEVETLRGLKRILCAGEALPGALLERFRERLPEVELHNIYGPSEAATAVTALRCVAEPGRGGVPIGGPSANARVYVVDDAGEPVPIGVAGELYVGGVPVARGYLGRARLTAERFVPDPFAADAGARLYRTGDVVRWLEDGRLEFVGRNDAQVKVRGFRVEPGEIEACLREHAGVREAVVVVREDAPGDRRLVAYCAGDERVDAESLRAHLCERLPDYMVPAAYVRLAALPLTPSGKVDRAALPAPEGEAYAARAYEAPVGEAERVLAEIWAEVLRVERVGRRDHFFELGGHSLLAVQVVSRVRQVLEVEVALGEIFIRPVLQDFARALETATPSELPPIKPAPRSGRLPLSFAQQRLWFLEQLGNLGGTYHVPGRLRMRGVLDRGALVRALDGIVARHEALRTTFAEVDGIPEQRIAPADVGIQLREHELGGRSDATAALERLMVEEAGAPFDLERGPLIRGRLVRLAEEDHVLLVTMHHIVSDAWSTGVLFGELSALYAAHREGREAAVPELPVQYADYAAWQRRWVTGEVLRQQADYWTAMLAGAPELLELPTDHPRPARQDHAGAVVGIDLGEALSAGLKALSQRHGTTLHMTLLAGWAAVLGRLSGQEDVVIGTPTANRGRREIEGLIGFFVNTLAVRVDLSQRPSVAELLGRVRERALEAQHHQDIPFEQVVELVQPVRSLAHAPLFQVMFAWQNAPREGLELPGLALAPLGAPPGAAAKLDLGLTLAEANGRIVGSVTYATSLFERATVERWMGYLRRVLEQMAGDEGRGVERLALMPESERARVLNEWNWTEAPYPVESCVHELFEAQVERAPDALALACGSEQLSYAELNARANRLAHHLRALGMVPEARVAISLERGPGTVVALLAVLKAGGAYVPLDPDYPVQRLRWMLEDSAPSLLLTRAPLAARFADAGVPLLDLADEAAWAGAPATDPERGALGPEHLAYLVYTSGSTGRPKGAMIRHRNVCAMVVAQLRSLPVEPASRVLQFASFSFDGHVFEVFLALARGASLHLSARPGVLAGDELVRTVAEAGITHAILPPAVLAALPDDEHLPSIHTLVVTGDAPPVDLMARWSSGRRLINGYGPTEATVCTTVHDHVPGASTPPPIGRPMANVRVYLLDAAGEPVPPGTTGELYIGGATVGRGYWRRPGMTAERFGPDPFGTEAGARLYRTGDLARWNAEGALEFAGRVDAQVKVRGFRIELGEIEARLLEHPAVREAVVQVREAAPGDRRLVAYVVGDPAAGADVLRGHVAERLPEYMVPAAYVRLDAMPLTPNGKLDRRALPAPEGDSYAARGYEAPLGPTEEALTGIWAEVLRIERVGRRDDFFDLGGHSLLAVQVISRVRQVMAVEIELGELFNWPVLSDFARVLETKSRAELPPIEPASRDGRVPLSFAQQRLWFVEQLADLGSTYHMHTRHRLRGALDRAALVRALDAVVARHEALRTTFVQVDGAPEQRIAPAEERRFHLAEHDVAGQPDPWAALQGIAAEEAGTPFCLERGPLMRGRLVRLAEDDHALLVTMHHIVSDGWSMGVLTGELSALYRAFRRGDPDPLPALLVQYADYAVWQRRWIEGDVLRAQADYWKQTLAGAPELLELPTDRPRPAQMDAAGGRVPVALDEALTAGLKALGRRHGATLFMTMLAGWAAVLSRLAGQDDVVVGTPTAGRGRREIEGLIGFFVNSLAVRADLSGAPTVAELLRRVKTRALEAQHHQDIPFEQVVELVQPVRSLAQSPLFQVMFAWQSAAHGGLALPGLEVGGVEARSLDVRAKFDLSLTLGVTGDRIVGGVTYATSLFERATVERWVGYLRRVLEEMAADDRRPVDRLPLMGADERAQVLEAWNRTDAAYPSRSCVHELFERQVGLRPAAAAVVFGDERVSYAELNARATRLAHYLRVVHGVVPETRVAFCIGRSVELIVAILGVLKAGGAYVPLDPSYPPARLEFMLDDSAPVVLLTAGDTGAEALGARSTVPVVDLGREAPAWASPAPLEPSTPLTAEHPAYVIYTSGSTGRPKGVVVTHGGACNLVAAQQRSLRVGPLSRVLQFASSSFDACVFEWVMALCQGAALHVPNAGGPLTGDVVREVIERAELTHVTLPPSLLATLPAAATLASVETMVVAGEALPAALVARWARGRRMLNAYGPTETTVWATQHECRADADGAPPIGAPIANMRVYVLDECGEPAPMGARGELYIGGPQVARGYVNRPGLTAERFVPDPFGPAGSRLYRTGDVARWRPDGALEYLGRTDFQVKVRGFRVELGEIEARLEAHAGVREAVVAARAGATGDVQLVAYYVEAPEAGSRAPSAEVLRAHLSETLPEHMVPAAYVRLDALPLTPNGKVDHNALPAPDGDAFARRGYEPPVGAVERALAEVWAEALGVERVGRHDHFFELGGHSLLAVTMIERLRRRGMRLEVRALFATPTLAELAATVDGGARELPVPPNRIPADCERITPELLPLAELTQREIDEIVAKVPGGAANVQDVYPLAPLQEGILFHHLLAQEGDPYVLAVLRDFPHRAALDAYVAALQAVVARHDILRTAMAWEGLREPVQVVWRHAPVVVEEVAPDAGVGDVGEHLWARYSPRHCRLDVRHAPLLRLWTAWDAAQGAWVVLLHYHHLIGDHVTMDVLEEELAAHLKGRADELPPALPFRTYVARARQGAHRDEQEAYFRQLLGDVVEPTAPFGLLDAWGDGSEIEEARLTLPPELSRGLRARARALGVSTASLCHVAWAQVVARATARRDVVFGTVLFGRAAAGEGGDRVPGPFINTLPMRIDVGAAGAEASVHAAHAQLGELLRHEHASLALAQRASGVPAPAPLFTALLNYRYGRAAPGPSAGVASSPASRARTRNNYPVTLSVGDLGDELRLTALVAASVGAARVCALMHTALASLVAALEEAPEAPLTELEVLPAAERALLLDAWNATDTPYPDDVCLHELVEQQAARTPDAVALVFADAQMSYAELDRRATRLAEELRAAGVGPDVRVGLCLERSLELLVALLGVLKAGGAYVPLDPSYPAERLRYLVADSAPAVVLLQRGRAAPWAAAGTGLRVIVLEERPSESEERVPPTAPAPRRTTGLTAEHLAYVLYTSGSTGRPKGVRVSHRNVVNVLRWMRALWQVDGEEIYLQKTPYNFDASLRELLLPLVGGARLVVARPEGHREAGYLVDVIARERVTTLHFVPSLLEVLLRDAELGACVGVRRVVCGGEALAPALARRFAETLPGARLWNVYGPTEAAVDVTASEVRAPEAGDAGKTIPLGAPMANTRAYVLDDGLDPVPVGVAGELYLGGAQVAQGYHGQPALTAERFVADPFAREPGGRLYRTGDLVRWRSDGTLEYLGRADHQVKVRGFRIELGEIEAQLREHAGVREAVVLAREDEPGETRLVAYWVRAAATGAEASAEALRAALAERLPEHMVPAAFVELEHFPLMPNGKLDRKALPSPDFAGDGSRPYEAPDGETETALAELWMQVLGVERVSRWDSFAALGGHSLRAIMLVGRIKRHMGTGISLQDVFKSPTLADMARCILMKRLAEFDPETLARLEREL